MLIEKPNIWWQELFYTTPNPCFVLSSGVIVEANQAAVNFFKLSSRSDLISKNILDFSPTHQDQHTPSIDRLKDLLNLDYVQSHGGLHSAWYFLDKITANTYPVELTLSVIPDTKLIFCCCRDLRAEEEIKNELLREHEFFRSAINGLCVPAFIINNEGIVTHWNTACVELTGVDASEIEGTSRHWMPFYQNPRPCLADLVISDTVDEYSAEYYGDTITKSSVLKGAWEASGYFPLLGNGVHLLFTASPLYNNKGDMIGAIETLQDISNHENRIRDLEERERVQRRLALTDKLTGLGNKRFFEAEYENAFETCKKLSLVFFDIDDFKHINDTYGHQVGDLVLTKIGSLLSTSARSNDLCIRYGGEEFLILMKNTESCSACKIMERFTNKLRNINFGTRTGEQFKITVSIGIAEREPDDCMQSLLERADSNSYAAKAAGKNCMRSD